LTEAYASALLFFFGSGELARDIASPSSIFSQLTPSFSSFAPACHSAHTETGKTFQRALTVDTAHRRDIESFALQCNVLRQLFLTTLCAFGNKLFAACDSALLDHATFSGKGGFSFSAFFDGSFSCFFGSDAFGKLTRKCRLNASRSTNSAKASAHQNLV
jgi:hypothetical protein